MSTNSISNTFLAVQLVAETALYLPLSLIEEKLPDQKKIMTKTQTMTLTVTTTMTNTSRKHLQREIPETSDLRNI